MNIAAAALLALLPFQEGDPNEYRKWSRHQPGSWSTVRQTLGTQVWEVKATLLELTDRTSVVEYQTRYIYPDRVEEQPARKHQFAPSDSPGPAPSATGTEELEILGRKLSCRWFDIPETGGDGVTVKRTWISDAVPGMLVKAEKKNADGKVLFSTALAGWESAAAPRMAENPNEYQRWVAFAPGSWVTFRDISGTTTYETTTVLVKRTLEKVVLEERTKVTKDGKTEERPPEVRVFPLNAYEAKAETRGPEDLEIAGVKLRCRWREWSVKSGGDVSRWKFWETESVPGLRVKREDWNDKDPKRQLSIALAWKAVPYEGTVEEALKREAVATDGGLRQTLAKIDGDFRKAFDAAGTPADRKTIVMQFAKDVETAGKPAGLSNEDLSRHVLEALQPLLARQTGEAFDLVLSLPDSCFNQKVMEAVLTKEVQDAIKAGAKRTVTVTLEDQKLKGIKDPQEQYAQGLQESKKGSYAKAADWYRKAAAQGHATAKAKLGGLGLATYLEGDIAAEKNDYSKALELWTVSADIGYQESYGRLGRLYHEGKLGTPDFAKAISWYQRGLDAGDLKCTIALGSMHVRGNGVPKDYAKARQFFQKAAEADLASGMINLAVISMDGSPELPADPVVGFYWARKAVAAGNAKAGELLKAIEAEARYSPPVIGLTLEEERWWRGFRPGNEADQARFDALNQRRKRTLKAAEGEDFNTALKLLNKNQGGQAMEILEPLAEKGHAGAVRLLALEYRLGIVLGLDPARSRKWAQKGADAGDPVCMWLLADALQSGPDRDEKAALEWHRKAAVQGWLPSMAPVAAGYRAAKDLHAACAWLQKAAENGDASAAAALKDVEAELERQKGR